MAGTWTTEEHGSVAFLTFSRPPQNFMDFASMTELGDILQGLAAETDRFKVIVLSGGLDGIFINHADLSDLAAAGTAQPEAQAAGSWPRAVGLLEEIPQPTIAAIDGLASGGGNEIALACTLRLGSERAQLQQPEVTVGIIPGGGGTVRLPRLIGPGAAAEAILTGRPFRAQEALRVGWINAVLPTDGFKEHALAWAATIARSPASSLSAAKKSLTFGSRMAFADALALEHELFTKLSQTSSPLYTAPGHA